MQHQMDLTRDDEERHVAPDTQVSVVAQPFGGRTGTAGYAPIWLILMWCTVVGAWLIAGLDHLQVCVKGGGLMAASRCSPGSRLRLTPHVTAGVVVGVVGLLLLLGLWRWDSRRTRRVLDAKPRTTRPLKLGAMAVGGALVTGLLLLFAPAPTSSHTYCPRIVQPAAHIVLAYNCDSVLFVTLAHHPARLLDKGQTRQDRPGYVVLSAATTAVVGPAVETFGRGKAYSVRDPAYVSMDLINFLTLAASVFLLVWLLQLFGAPRLVTLALAAVLMFNEVTKAFLWTPHQQIFGLLTPLATVVICRRLLLTPPRLWQTCLLGGALGIGMLVYGNVMITIAGALIALVWRSLSTPGSRTERFRRAAVAATVLGVTSAAPTLAWIGICKAVAGSYYNHEVVRFRQFVWVADAWHAGGHALGAALWHVTSNTAAEFLQTTTIFLAAVAALAVAGIVAGVALRPATAPQRATLVATGLTLALSVVFLWAMGFWQSRITYAVVPLLLVVTGWIATRLSVISRRWATSISTVLLCAAAAGVLYELTQPRPVLLMRLTQAYGRGRDRRGVGGR